LSVYEAGLLGKQRKGMATKSWPPRMFLANTFRLVAPLRDNLEDASWAARCKRTMVHLRDEGVFFSTGIIQYDFAWVETEAKQVAQNEV
jgi:hypothetical protein